MQNDPTPFGLLLRNIRNEKGMTLRELGEKTDLTFGYIAQVERGFAAPPSLRSIAKLAEVLQVSQSVLLTEADKKKAPNAACIADIYEYFKTKNSLSDNQFVEIAEKHNLLADDLTLLP